MNGLGLRDERLRDDDLREPAGTSRALLILVALLLLLVAALGYIAYRVVQQMRAVERQMAAVTAKTETSAALARQALEKATASEAAARAAAEGRQLAETQTQDAKQQADAARQEAMTAKETAAQAQAEAAAIRKKAEEEVNRLQSALGQIAETRRTALGLVMNLGGDHLKFAFNKADLQPSDKELLSRIAGILITSHDYTISVNGHTDDVGSDAYNKKLSERRAQAVRDYLVQAGLSPEILSVEGHGKSLPLVRGTSEAARAKNRRVELGLVNTQIRYMR
jgi:outer membrane protein OmpA-like peptidoglycan-associated protein